MITTTTRGAHNAVSTLSSFTTGGALRGSRHTNTYAVHSYEALIAEVYPNDPRKLAFFDNRKYSVTTSRHQNLVKRALLDAGYELIYHYNWQQFLDNVASYEPTK